MFEKTIAKVLRGRSVTVLAPLVLGYTLVSANAQASGSVSVEVLGQRCSVSLEQTFRKILRRGGGIYYRRVGERFRRRIGQVLPAVERTLAQASRRQRALVPYDLRYRRRSCPPSGSCAKESRGPYPVLLRLPIVHRGDARHRFWVSLPLRRALSAKVLAKLRTRLQALIERDGGTDGTRPTVSAQRIPSEDRKTAQLHLRVKTTRRAILTAVPQLRAQLAALAQRASALVQATLKRTKGSPRFGHFVEGKKLPPYRIGNPLPAILSLHGGNGFTTISVELVLTHLRTDRERIAFARDFEQKLSTLLPR